MKGPEIKYKAVLLVALMVLVGPSTLVNGASTSTSSGEITLTPTVGNNSILANFSSIVQVPENHTITGGMLEILTEWDTVVEEDPITAQDTEGLGQMGLMTTLLHLPMEENSHFQPIHHWVP